MNLLIFNLKTDANDNVLGFTTNWINSIAKNFDRVFVITMYSGYLKLEKNIDVYSVGQERGYSKLRRLINFYIILIKLLSKEKVDVCFVHMIPIFAILAWPLTFLNRIPILMWYAHGAVPLTLKIATKLVDKIITSSDSGFRIKSDKVSILGQGIDVVKFQPSGSPKKIDFEILTVGRISPIKRLEVLIEALPKIPSSVNGRKVVLNFVGNPLTDRDNRYFADLKSLIDKLGVTQRVIFTPAKSYAEIQRIYSQADIFVNSSETGSMDKTVLEAMSSGIPVITSNMAFASDEFKKLCYWEANDSNSLSLKISDLISLSEQSRFLLGLSLRKIVVEKHSLELLTKKIVSNLKKLTK